MLPAPGSPWQPGGMRMVMTPPGVSVPQPSYGSTADDGGAGVGAGVGAGAGAGSGGVGGGAVTADGGGGAAGGNVEEYSTQPAPTVMSRTTRSMGNLFIGTWE